MRRCGRGAGLRLGRTGRQARPWCARVEGRKARGSWAAKGPRSDPGMGKKERVGCKRRKIEVFKVKSFSISSFQIQVKIQMSLNF